MVRAAAAAVVALALFRCVEGYEVYEVDTAELHRILTTASSGPSGGPSVADAPCTVAHSDMVAGSACACLGGYNGTIAWSAGTASGTCTAVACNIANSDNVAGPSCACDSNHEGTISWVGTTVSGTCTACAAHEMSSGGSTSTCRNAQCTVANSTSVAGSACACSNGYNGTISWSNGAASGTCAAVVPTNLTNSSIVNTTVIPAPPPSASVSFNVTLSMSVADAIGSFNLSQYQSQLAGRYEAGANVSVDVTFKMKVSYTFSGTVTETTVKPEIASTNAVDESQVSVVISPSPSRRLGSSRRLQGSIVAAEISTSNQTRLASLQQTMQTDLVVAGSTATAGNATVELELVTTVLQSTQAVPPPQSAVEGFFTGIAVTAVVSDTYGVVWTIMPCSDSTMVCNSGRQKIAGAASTGCSDESCGQSDEPTCCEATGLAGGSNAETLSRPFITILMVFLSSLLL